MGKIIDNINSINETNEKDAQAAMTDFFDKLSKFGSIYTPENVNGDVLFRDKEVNLVSTIVNKMEHRAVILVGDYGCGKNTIVKGVVEKGTNVFCLDTNAFMDNINNINDLKSLMDDCFKLAYDASNFVVYIRNIGQVLNSNCFGNAGYVFVNRIVQYIENDNIRIITTATNEEYKKLEDDMKPFINACHTIKVDAMDVEQSKEIARLEKDEYETHYSFKIKDEFIDMMCDHADKHVKSCVFPMKALVAVDEVCSKIEKNLGDRSSETTKELSQQLEESNNRVADLIIEGNLNEANDLLDVSIEIEKKLEKAKNADKKKKTILTEDMVMDAISSVMNVPLAKLTKDQSEFLKNMPIELKKSIIGQDETIDKIVKNVRRNKLGLRKVAHTIGNFMFIGSTGVGKTALAKALAKYLYGSEDNMLRMDMSEYQSEIDVNKLLGSSPGYVGYKESGVLVKGLAKKPECVILFDEIEKAHPRIYDVLLQLLDEGFITGGDGKKVDARNALLIMTSNVGVKQAKEFSRGLGFTVNTDVVAVQSSNEEKVINKALKKRFSPEFLNRLDGVCYFNNLSKDVLKNILIKELGEMNVNIKKLTGKEVELSDKLNEYLIDKVIKENNGARPIIRLLQQEIEESIADMMVDGSEILQTKKKVLTADLDGENVILK